jgi:hypothetical protein
LQRFPNNPYYQNFKCIVCIVKSIAEFEDHIFCLGLGINVIGEKRKEVSWSDKLWAMAKNYHRYYEVIIYYLQNLFKYIF